MRKRFESGDRTRARFVLERELTGLTQTQLAERIKVSPATVKAWERKDVHSVPSEKAWRVLEKLLDEQDRFVRNATVGVKPGETAIIQYIRTPLSRGNDAKTNIYNAKVRALAGALRDGGIPYRVANLDKPPSMTPNVTYMPATNEEVS